MLWKRKAVVAAIMAAQIAVAALPCRAAVADPEIETGPGGLARLLAAEAERPSAAIELRIAQLYGPGPADIGPGGLPAGSIGPEGVPVDYGRAMTWLRRAAAGCGEDDGSPSQAQFQIGDMYAYGAGVRQDKTQALAWYLISTKLGASGLRGEYVDGMKGETTRAQQGEATKRARNFLAGRRQRCGRS